MRFRLPRWPSESTRTLPCCPGGLGVSESTTALLPGGAGLIGSHIVDGALARGWEVHVLDNWEPQTHRHGKPAWIPAGVGFVRGDVRHRRDWERALDGVDVAGRAVPGTVVDRVPPR